MDTAELAGRIKDAAYLEGDFVLRSGGEFRDFCDSCCEVRSLVAVVRSVPGEEVWLDLVCQSCLDCLVGAKAWSVRQGRSRSGGADTGV